MKGIQIDRKRQLADDARTGHNRWHPEIAPAIEVDEGEEVALETRDALDGYLTPSSTVADLNSLPVGAEFASESSAHAASLKRHARCITHQQREPQEELPVRPPVRGASALRH